MSQQLNLYGDSDNGYPFAGEHIVFPEGLKTTEYTHGIHRFPGKFVPQVPRLLLQNLNSRQEIKTVCDPFCGSGTTLVEAAVTGSDCFGFDIDPLGILIAKAKTTVLEKHQLSLLIRLPFEVKYSVPSPELFPNIENLRHWFSHPALHELSSIKAKILSLLDIDVRNIALTIFSSIIRRVSFADNQTQKTYVSHTYSKSPPLPSELFPIAVTRAVSGLADFANSDARGRSIIADIADSKCSPDRNFSCIITSPPYVDSIDYVYNQMLEYFWLMDIFQIPDRKAINQLRKQPLGFRQCNLEESIEALRKTSPAVAKDVAGISIEIAKTSKKESCAVASYFNDFSAHLQAFCRSLRRGEHYALIIGESVICGRLIPTRSLLRRIFHDVGFIEVGNASYQIKRHYMKFPRRTNSGKIDTDYICIFSLQ